MNNEKCELIVRGLAALSLTVLLLLSGCTDRVSGTQFQLSQTEKIIKGKTTKQEILEMFGEPLNANNSPITGQAIWMYHYSEYSKSLGTFPYTNYQRDSKSLMVMFKHGVVNNFTVTTGSNKGKYNSAW